MFDALTLLLDHGADLEARTSTGGTALAWGCMGGDARIVRLMLDRGANIFAVNQVWALWVAVFPSLFIALYNNPIISLSKVEPRVVFCRLGSSYPA